MRVRFYKSVTFSMLSAVLLLTGCSEPVVQKMEGHAQGTTYHISYWSKLPLDPKAVELSVKTELELIDKGLSNYRPDSVIEVFNSKQNTDSQEVGTELVDLVRISHGVYQASHGCYDLTTKPLFTLWGFHGDNPAIPTQEVIANTLSEVGMDKLEVVDATHLRKKQANIKVDVSSIAQGFSVGKISRLLEQQGITDYLVEIGGELQTRGHKPDEQPWRIALERPLPGEQHMQKRLTMPIDSAMAVMTSGTYNHYFEHQGKRYSHIIDARNGWPIQHDLVSVTVITPDPTVADAWDTALLCLGQAEGLKAANDANIPALFIQQQGTNLIETRSAALVALDKVIIE